MIIEINKDIDHYKETVIMGLTTRQLAFSIASIVVGSGIVLLLYPLIGLTPSVYVAIPAVAPVALGGFYSFNGMDFYEFMRIKLKMLFANRPLVYVSTECRERIKEGCKEDWGRKKSRGKVV
ncbi:MAG: PrgI family protein [Lachnospiraceae bacterium]|nr:PrgI family protein [Lachnospiraceae bacterium]